MCRERNILIPRANLLRVFALVLQMQFPNIADQIIAIGDSLAGDFKGIVGFVGSAANAG
jgi:hypothetical protein